MAKSKDPKPKASPAPGPSLRARRPVLAERFGPELRNLMAQTAKSFGFSVPDILMAWPEIVGERLAARAYPEKLSRRSIGGAYGGVLTLRCRGSAALEVQHEVPRIIERLNIFAGQPLVEQIRIVQGDIPLVAEQRLVKKTPLSPDQMNHLAQGLEAIDNPALKSALKRLGQAVLARRTTTNL